MTLIIRCNSLVLAAIFVVFIKTNFCIAECDLSKIFRTPKDRTNINFDHLEIVERASFDPSESITTPKFNDLSPSKSTKKNGNNYANAQVSVRFGSDYDNSHIMKIPPQCRHLVGNPVIHPADVIPNTNFFYPPPPHTYPPSCHQYYHPYPPPVPYVFPNYYFWSPRGEPEYLPPQLNEYFRRHPDFVVGRCPNHEGLVGGRPVRKDEFRIPANFVDELKMPAKNITDLQMTPTNADSLKPVHIILSRILKPLNPTNEANNPENKEMKRDCESAEHENEDQDGNDISMDFSESFEETPYENCDIKESEEETEQTTLKLSENEFDDDLKKVLAKALVAYKCRNCTGSPKMLISYPIINRDAKLDQDLEPIASSNLYPNGKAISKQGKFANDIDSLRSINTEDITDDSSSKKCRCNSTTNNVSTGKGFLNDFDDLLSILIEIIETGNNSPSPPDDTLRYSDSRPPTMKSCLLGDSVLYPDNLPSFISTKKSSEINDEAPKVKYPKIEAFPLMAAVNLDIADYALSNAQPSFPTLSQCACSSSRTNSEYSSSHRNGYKPGSKAIVIYHSLPQMSTFNLNEGLPNGISKIEYGKGVLPETYLQTRKVYTPKENSLPRYLKVIPLNAIPTANMESVDMRSTKSLPKPIVHHVLEPSNYFLPESNVFIKKKTVLPKYLQVIPREDLETLPLEEKIVLPVDPYSNTPLDLSSRMSESGYCTKCGQRHSGGNYCDKCGYPLVIDQSPMNPSCPTCPKETRQLNDW